jgi:hypothetical protein
MRKRKKQSRMMVIRVRVPEYLFDAKVYQVVVLHGEQLHLVEVLNAYYDVPGQPGVQLSE